MRKFLLACSVMLLATGLSSPGLAQVAAETIYTVENWPEDIGTLPCDAFKKESDGWWVQNPNVALKTGNVTMRGESFKQGPEAKALEDKCGTAAKK